MIEGEFGNCQIENRESPTNTLCPDWCPLREGPVVLVLNEYSGKYSKQRQEKCLWCRMGLPLAETEPEHEWFDKQSNRLVTVPCYFDMIEDADEEA